MPGLDPDQLFGPLAMPAIHRVVILPVAPDYVELRTGGFFPR